MQLELFRILCLVMSLILIATTYGLNQVVLVTRAGTILATRAKAVLTTLT